MWRAWGKFWVVGLLTCVTISASIGVLFAPWQMNSHVLTPILPLLSLTEDRFLSGANFSKRTESPFSEVHYFSLSNEEFRRQLESARPREPEVVGANRVAIANILDGILKARTKPELVIMDIDITPVADTSMNGSASELQLFRTLQSWNQNQVAPPLMLVRSNGCGEQGIEAGTLFKQEQLRATPYDGEVWPTANKEAKVKIAWVCAMTPPSHDGIYRSMLAYGCYTDWSGPRGLPSPGTLFVALRERKLRSTLAEAANELQKSLTNYCRIGDSSKAVVPVLFNFDRWSLDDADIKYTSFVSAPLEAKEQNRPFRIMDGSSVADQPIELDLNGSLVVVGQDHDRALDYRNTTVHHSLPGFAFVAAHVDTMLRFNGSQSGSSLQRSWFAFLGGLTVLFGFAIGRAMKPILRERPISANPRSFMERYLYPSARGFARVAFSPPAIGSWAAASSTFLLGALIAPQLSIYDWPSLWMAVMSCAILLLIFEYILPGDV